MKNFIEKPQGLKTKEEVVNKAFCFIAVSKANKVMEFLASHYEFRNNIANNVTEFKKVGEAEFRDMTEIDLNSIWLNMSRDQEKGVDVGVDTLKKSSNPMLSLHMTHTGRFWKASQNGMVVTTLWIWHQR